jgi:hypothetical protein
MTLPEANLSVETLDPAALPEGTYAVVEQLGHCTLVGRVAEVERFGAPFLQIEPLFCDMMLGPVLLGGSSIYRFTPCPASAAWGMRAKYRHELPASVAALIPVEADSGRFDTATAPAFLGFDSASDYAGDDL